MERNFPVTNYVAFNPFPAYALNYLVDIVPFSLQKHHRLNYHTVLFNGEAEQFTLFGAEFVLHF